MNNFPEYKYDLSLEHDGSNRFMVWIMACFVFVATLAMFSAMAADKMVSDWQSYAVNQATLEIPYGPDNENIGLTLAERLAPLNVIDSVEIIPPEETTALVQSAIGTSADDETVDLSNLPLPLLLTVSFNEDMSEQDFKTLSGLIREVEPEVRIHRHERWASDILDYGKVLRGGALLLLILMAAMTVLTLIWTLISRVNVHHEEIVTLNTVGADDDYISRQFLHFALSRTMTGCVIGLALALIVFIGVNFKLDMTGTIPGFGWTQVLTWLFVPLLACMIIAFLTARITLMRTFAKL